MEGKMGENQESIFTKIVKGEIPCNKVYEDSKTLAFLDIQPVNEGHTLVITKKEYKDFLDMPEDELGSFMKTVHKVAKAVKNAVNADGVNVTTNIGKAAGQEVFHVHFHIIPRFLDDGLRMWPKNEDAKSDQEIAGNIAKYL